MKIFSRYPATIVTTVLAAALLAISLVGEIDFLEVLHDLERYEIDELIIPIFLIVFGVLSDYRMAQLRHQAEIRRQRLQVLHATMRTVQDIVNNMLNQLHVIELENAEALSEESSKLLQGLIEDTAEKMRKLGDLEDTPEIAMPNGVGIDYEDKG